MNEARRTTRFRRSLGIALICLATHAMNAEPKATVTGIEGTVSVGPIHGGPIKEGEPASMPMAEATFLVETAAGTIKTFTTDKDGHFKVELPAGRYSIRAERPAMKGRGCGLKDIEVTGAGFKQVDLQCDTGMR